ncbi:family ATpase [Cryptosporidium sp. chipmunk genotype I]|uniref:family ATpase n=1 Tax=Cryptosporidium sp. chipmunk genotype I TaxID=1280935 RepID=UPI00351A8EAB|nr:family ATpase [Cryptosporidium sp. chipmunk genotype I]
MGKIRKLSDEVISRIAAGEVVVSPSHALKELLENSLDAGSRNIILQLRKGGIQSLQISDDGSGIDKSDFPMLCERFATSKLTTMKDIESLKTFGFRGEALSSISFVSQLSITSKTEGSGCAYKASFSDGRMISELEEVASAKKGTVVQINDLFYNMPSRQRTMGSASDEYAKCLDLVQKYSIEFPEVSFNVRKFGQNSNDLRTSGGVKTRRNVIGLLYGSHVVKELIQFTVSRDSERPRELSGEERNDLSLKIPDYSAELYISGLGYNPKQNTLIIFINGRLVKNNAIKQAIETAYQYTKSNYWAFVSVRVPSETIDPNIHPTKNLVYISHEALISDAIQRKVICSLQASNYSRNMVLEKKPRFELRDYSSSSESKSNYLDSTKNLTRVRTDSKQLVLQEYSSNSILNHSNISLISRESKQYDSYNNAKNVQYPSQEPKGSEEKLSEEMKLSNKCQPEFQSGDNGTPEQGFSLNKSSENQKSENFRVKLHQSASENSLKNKQIFRLFDISNYVSDAHILSWSLSTDSIPLIDEMRNFQMKMKQKFLTEIEIRNGNTKSTKIEYLNSLTKSIINGIYIGQIKSFWSIMQAKNQILLINIEQVSKIALKQSLICRLGYIPLLRLNPPVGLRDLSLFTTGSIKSYELNENDQAQFEDFIQNQAYMYFEILKVFGINYNSSDNSFSTFPLFFGNFIPNLDFLPELLEHVIFACWNFHIAHACKRKLSNTGNIQILCRYFNEENNNLSEKASEDCILKFYRLFIELIDILVDYYLYGIEDNELLFQAIRNNNNLILVEDDISRNIIELSSLEKLYRVFERC